MEFGKHLTKGIWGLADKALPVVYGLGYVWLVIRVLPEQEFGNFVLVQEIFLIISGLTTAFALQPLLKFSSEPGANLKDILSASLLLNTVCVIVASLMVVVFSGAAAELLNSPALAPLLLYIPAMLAASFVRNTALVLLQATFRFRDVFWVDAVHFLGAPVLVEILSRMHRFDSALDMVLVNIISLSLSSIVGLWYARKITGVTLSPARATIGTMYQYGKYSLGGVVSSLVSQRADSFILSAFTGPLQVALYNSVKVFVRVFEMAAQIVQMFVLAPASRLSSLGEFGSLKALTEKAILFLTVSLVPITLLFLLFPSFLVHILYGERYAEAAPILRVFAGLTFVVPLAAVGSNVLMGLGEARATFVLGIQTLAVSLIAFFVCIPSGGALGAGAGYLIAAVLTGGLTWRLLVRHVPLTVSEVVGRVRDIFAFVRRRR